MPPSPIINHLVRTVTGRVTWHMREPSTCKSPRLVWISPSTFHKFQVGQIVTIRLALSRNVPGGVYTVTKQLPENHGEFEYRIKSVDEVHERVARESELIKA